MSDAIRWLPIDPDEVDEVSFDFRLYAKGVPIVLPLQVSVEVLRGADDQAASALVGGAQNVQGEVLQLVQGRLEGVIYKIRCRAVFQDGRAHVLAGILPCERK